jgi:thiamine kinase-like enzyme
VYRAISGLGFCDDPVYLDESSGVKITRYIEDARTCSAYDEDDVRRCMDLLRRLHGMELKVGHTFDVFDRIEFYESLRGRPSVHKDYEETRKSVFSLKPFIDEQKKQWCLSHIDSVCDNFLVYEGGIQLTDWEYAGMQDPHIDIAMFCVYGDYSREQVDRIIDLYFDGGCSSAERRKIYCYIAACGLLWSNWCEYKYLLGVDFGAYAQRQYQYAKDYI